MDMPEENAHPSSVLKTYRVRLLPRRRTHRKLQHTLDTCRDANNDATPAVAELLVSLAERDDP